MYPSRELPADAIARLSCFGVSITLDGILRELAGDLQALPDHKTHQVSSDIRTIICYSRLWFQKVWQESCATNRDKTVAGAGRKYFLILTSQFVGARLSTQ